MYNLAAFLRVLLTNLQGSQGTVKTLPSVSVQSWSKLGKEAPFSMTDARVLPLKNPICRIPPPIP